MPDRRPSETARASVIVAICVSLSTRNSVVYSPIRTIHISNESLGPWLFKHRRSPSSDAVSTTLKTDGIIHTETARASSVALTSENATRRVPTTGRDVRVAINSYLGRFQSPLRGRSRVPTYSSAVRGFPSNTIDRHSSASTLVYNHSCKTNGIVNRGLSSDAGLDGPKE